MVGTSERIIVVGSGPCAAVAARELASAPVATSRCSTPATGRRAAC